MSHQSNQIVGFETVTVAATAIGFTAATIGRANYALVTVETAPIRWRADGTDPTASVGHLVAAGDVIVLDEWRDLNNFMAIRTGDTSASISVSYGATA